MVRFEVQVEASNEYDSFDAVYDFGQGNQHSHAEGDMEGTPEEIAAEVARFLASLRPEDMLAMGPEFCISLHIRPVS